MMMRPGDILGRIFYVVTEINHRIIGIYPRSTRRTRNFYPRRTRFFLVATLEILEEIFFKYCASARNIFNYPRTKIFKRKSLTRMRSSSGCCPGLGKPLGFQPVFACVSKSLEESLTRISKL